MPVKPKLGQNFLVDSEATQRIAASIGDLSGRTVVEIGPGRGAITATLAARAGHVIAVELDRELAARLRAEFSAERVTVVEQDVLQFDFAEAATFAGPRRADGAARGGGSCGCAARLAGLWPAFGHCADAWAGRAAVYVASLVILAAA